MEISMEEKLAQWRHRRELEGKRKKTLLDDKKENLTTIQVQNPPRKCGPMLHDCTNLLPGVKGKMGKYSGSSSKSVLGLKRKSEGPHQKSDHIKKKTTRESEPRISSSQESHNPHTIALQRKTNSAKTQTLWVETTDIETQTDYEPPSKEVIDALRFKCAAFQQKAEDLGRQVMAMEQALTMKDHSFQTEVEQMKKSMEEGLVQAVKRIKHLEAELQQAVSEIP